MRPHEDLFGNIKTKKRNSRLTIYNNKFMFYEKNKLRVHQIIFLICIIFSSISPKISYEEIQAKWAETNTWNLETRVDAPVQMSGAIDKKKQYYVWWWMDKVTQESCWVDCKIQHLENIWIIPEIAESLVQNCKALAENPIRCIKTGAFIVVNESSGWKSCKKSNPFNCFGLSVQEDYKSYNDWVIHFIWKYNRFWLNQTSPNGFYSNSPDWKPATRFCLSETSSWLPYCKNWHRIAWSVFNKLNKLF